MGIYFTLWVCNPRGLYFVPQIVSAVAIRSSFNWFLCHFDIPLSLWIFFFLSFFSFCLSVFLSFFLERHYFLFVPTLYELFISFFSVSLSLFWPPHSIWTSPAGIGSEPQVQPMQQWQHLILNLLCRARDGTWVPALQRCHWSRCATEGTLSCLYPFYCIVSVHYALLKCILSVLMGKSYLY